MSSARFAPPSPLTLTQLAEWRRWCTAGGGHGAATAGGKGKGRKGKAENAVNALLAATKCAEAARRRMLPSRGGGKQKMHRPWSLPEVQALVDGVARFGRGQWADIKALEEGGVSRDPNPKGRAARARRLFPKRT